jgi:glycosyltransferase involved in cell wall biosynthesis
MEKIDVSVVIAVKNEHLFVKDAVLSVLYQENLSYEIIVIDDNSTDNTYEIVSALSAVNPKIRLQKNPNSGKTSAFNFGVELAKGEYVCLFAGDDLMPQDSLTRRWQAVKEFPNQDEMITVGLCKYRTISEYKRFDGHIIPKKRNRGGFTGVSYLMNRKAVASAFPVPESLPNEDSWLYLAFTHLPNVQLIHSDIIGCHFRIHANNSIGVTLDFDTYNKRITARMASMGLFREAYNSQLSQSSLFLLEEKIECENFRINKKFTKIMLSKLSLIDKLRVLSIYNSFFYNLKRFFFSYLTNY